MKKILILLVFLNGCSMVSIEENKKGNPKIRVESGYEPCRFRVKGGFNPDEVYYECEWTMK